MSARFAVAPSVLLWAKNRAQRNHDYAKRFIFECRAPFHLFRELGVQLVRLAEGAA